MRWLLALWLSACSEKTELLIDAGTLPAPDAGELPTGPRCGDGVLETGEACYGRSVYLDDHFAFPIWIRDVNGDGLDDVLAFVRIPSGVALFSSREGEYERAWFRDFGTEVVGYVDSDPLEDLVGIFTSSASWWRGEPDGSFREQSSFSIDPDHELRSIRIADLGNDGDAQLVYIVRLRSQPSVERLFVRTFDGSTFGDPVEHSLPLQEWSLRTIDWDGDGALELLLQQGDYRAIQTYSLARWQSGLLEAPIDVPELSGQRLYFVDLDGVEPLDFAVEYGRGFNLFFNHGGVLEPLPAPIESISDFIPRFANVDADPMHELIEFIEPRGPILIRDLPSGDVVEERSYPYELYDVRSDVDLNRDDSLDLLVIGETLQAHVRAADGTLGPPNDWRTDTAFTFFLDPMNADGDGAMDLLCDSAVTLRRNQDRVLSVPDVQPATQEPWVSIAATDLHGDLLPDIVALSELGNLSLFRGTGQGLDPPDLQLQAIEHFALGDFDGDPIPDMAIATVGSIGIARSDGLGKIEAPSVLLDVGDRVLELDVADVNGDGFADVVYRVPGKLGVLVGNGDGALTKTTTTTSHDDATITLADIDDDGIGEIISMSAAGLLIIDGALTIARRQPGFRTVALATGDFDRDGDVDLIAAAGALALFDGDGSGGFGESKLVLASCCEGDAITADLDLDEAPEVVATDMYLDITNTAVRAMRDRGSGLRTVRLFGAGAIDSLELFPTNVRVAVADVNRDGYPDVIATHRSQLLVFFAYP